MSKFSQQSRKNTGLICFSLISFFLAAAMGPLAAHAGEEEKVEEEAEEEEAEEESIESRLRDIEAEVEEKESDRENSNRENSNRETKRHDSEASRPGLQDEESEEEGEEMRDEEVGGEEVRSQEVDGESDEGDDVDAELDDLEADVSNRNAGRSSSQQRRGSTNDLNPNLSIILDTGFAWQSDEATLVGGPDPKRFGFFFQGAELAFEADVDPFFTFDAHLIAQLDGLKVGEAYGTTLALPAGLQARFGKFKTEFGRVNPIHLHAWKFTALPLVNGKMFGPAGLNGLGLEVSQLLPLPWYVEWTLALQDLSAPPTGRAFLRKPELVESPFDFVASGRLEQFFELSPDTSLLFGLNGAVGRNDSGGGDRRDELRTEIFGLDWYAKWKAADRNELGWQTEAMARRRETPAGARRDVGGYSYLYWAPVPRWEVGGRYGAVSGPLEAEEDELHPDWLEWRHRIGPALTHYPTEFSRFRLEYMASSAGSGFNDPEHVVLLQAQLVTGAHGAHKY